MVELECIDQETPDLVNDTFIIRTTVDGFLSYIWSWISVGSPGVMLHVEERLNNYVYIRILENIMVPSVTIAYPNNDYIFQQDNCSVHTARRVTEWF
jgi:hypothetical protein